MSVFGDFQRVWVERFPDSALPAAWEEDVRANLVKHKQKVRQKKNNYPVTFSHHLAYMTHTNCTKTSYSVPIYRYSLYTSTGINVEGGTRKGRILC